MCENNDHYRPRPWLWVGRVDQQKADGRQYERGNPFYLLLTFTCKFNQTNLNYILVYPCKRKSLNHFLGNKVEKQNFPILTSCFWMATIIKSLAKKMKHINFLFLIFGLGSFWIDPRGQPKVQASSYHYFHMSCPSVRPSVCTYVRYHKTKVAGKKWLLLAGWWIWPSGSLMTQMS